MSDSLQVFFPAADNDAWSTAMRILTRELAKLHPDDMAYGLFGGQWGYGCKFENDTFQMHPYCWCEKDDCRWCGPEDAPHFTHKATGATVRWYKYIGRSQEVKNPNDATVDSVLSSCLESIGTTLMAVMASAKDEN